MPSKRSLPETPSPHSKRVRRSATSTPNSKISVKTEFSVKKTVVVKKSTPKKTKINGVKIEIASPEKVKQQVNGKTDAPATEAKPKKRSKPKKPNGEMLAARTSLSKILVGAHVSAAGGAHNAILNSHKIGGNAFALFLKSQRQWAFTPLSEENATLFLNDCSKHNYHASHSSQNCAPIVPHGSYLVNLAHTDGDRAKQAYMTFIDDLSRCKRMGIGLYNFHPGSAVGQGTREDALKQLAKQLNKSHKDEQSGTVVTLLETMAAVGGNTIGCKFEELAAVIEMVEDKTRVGVCLDTCHSFAAGYDLRTPEAYAETIRKFDNTVGLKYLRAFHVNDSKAPMGSGRDLHANIGTGYLGLRSFWNLVNDERMWGIPFILETPIDHKDANGKTVEDEGIWAKEIKLLESLVGMNLEGEEFKKLETELSAQGKAERDRIGEQIKKAMDKKAKKAGRDIRNMF